MESNKITSPVQPQTDQSIQQVVSIDQPEIETPQPAQPGNMNNKVIAGFLGVLILIGVGGYMVMRRNSQPVDIADNVINNNSPIISDNSQTTSNDALIVTHNGQVACTEEAKECPDGSFVSRQGPNCEFEECPDAVDMNYDKSQDGWSLYSNPDLGLSLMYPPIQKPTSTFSPGKSGEPIFVISEIFNFRSLDIPKCQDGINPKTVCLIPGENWGQENDIQPITIAGEKAFSFFLLSTNQDGNSTKVLHVIQKAESITFELVFAVDGAGLEQTFQGILDTIKFDN